MVFNEPKEKKYYKYWTRSNRPYDYESHKYYDPYKSYRQPNRPFTITQPRR
jgi:hypothetical protein